LKVKKYCFKRTGVKAGILTKLQFLAIAF